METDKQLKNKIEEFKNAIGVLIKYSNDLNDKGYCSEYVVTQKEIVAVTRNAKGEYVAELPLMANRHTNHAKLREYCLKIIAEIHDYNRKQPDSFSASLSH